MTQFQLPEVFSAGEIARAAGVHPEDVRRLVEEGEVSTVGGRFVATDEAVRAVRKLTGRAAAADRSLFRPLRGGRRHAGMPLALSGALHAGMLAVVVLTTMGIARGPAQVVPQELKNIRLVFLAVPGPGGGGGGGGLRKPEPPPPAARKGPSALRSPLPSRRPPPPVEPPVRRASNPPPPILKAEPLPPIVAPVAPVAADRQDRAGLPVQAPPVVDSHGPGTGGGAGADQGTGLGEGQGPGVGRGSGGGTGDGPYRPGSGITPPAVLHEVAPDYTEEARRRNLEGDVVLEIVVRRDGTVGDVKLLQGLGAGLNQRAVDAVRQWRFSPARRLGTAVDVIVEVAVEFKLR